MGASGADFFFFPACAAGVSDNAKALTPNINNSFRHFAAQERNANISLLSSICLVTVTTELQSRGNIFDEHGARAARVGLMTAQASQRFALRRITWVRNASDRVTVHRMPSTVGETERGDMLVSEIVLGQANLAVEDRSQMRVLDLSVN